MSIELLPGKNVTVNDTTHIVNTMFSKTYYLDFVQFYDQLADARRS